MKWTLCYGLLFPFDQNTGQEMMIETKPEMNLKARNLPPNYSVCTHGTHYHRLPLTQDSEKD